MVDADIDDISETSVIATRGHDDNVWVAHLSHLLLAFNDVPKIASRTGCVPET